MEEGDGEREVIWQGESHKGKLIGLDEDGNLLMSAGGATTSLSLAGVIERSGKSAE